MGPPETIGILFEAKRRALTRSLKKELVDLIIKNVFFIDEELYNTILREAGEF